MDLNHEHNRKGLVATILIHSIIFLLMLIWIMGEAKDMEEPAGGVEVSFGDPDAGGPSDISQVANTTPAAAPPSNPDPSETQNDNPVVTNDDADQPEMDNSKQKTQKTTNTDPVKDPTKTEEPTISAAQKAIQAFKDRQKANSDKTTSTGDGPKDGPKGDPGSTKKGPGGQSSGTMGNVNYNLDGFGISKNPNIINTSQDDGSVKISFCVDSKGKLITNTVRVSGGTATSTYLKNLSKNAIKQFEFYPFGDQAATNCGTITFNYALH